jgi:GAF domain-containing protein
VSAEIVNLRQFKKTQARSEKDRQAEQNRISFGRTKAEKQLTKALNDKAEKTHNEGRIEKDGGEER